MGDPGSPTKRQRARASAPIEASNGSGVNKVGTAPGPGPGRRQVEVPRGQTSESERPWRAAALTFAGSASILFFAYPRELMLANVQWLSLWGQLVGMVGIVLALFMVIYPRAANVIGPFAIIAGIVGFPIMLGGVLVGSFALVLGGGMAFSWEPAPPGSTAEVSRSLRHLPSRIVAGVVDLTLLLVAVAIPATTFLHDPMRDYPALTYLVEIGLWAAIFLPGAVRGISPGKLLMRLRAWEKGSDGRPGTRSALIREAIRGSQFLVGVMLLPWIVHLPETVAAVLGAAAVATVILSAHVGWTIHDHFAGTEVVALHVRLPQLGEPGGTSASAAAVTAGEKRVSARNGVGSTSKRGSQNGAGTAAGTMRVHPARSSPTPNGSGKGARTAVPVAAAPGGRGERPRRPRAGQNDAVDENERARNPARR